MNRVGFGMSVLTLSAIALQGSRVLKP